MSMQQTKQRREAVGTIHDIVSAMRAIAAGRIQGAQRALAAAARYEHVVLDALAALLDSTAHLPTPPATARSRLLLVFTSEQPLCGTFNQDILAFAEHRWAELRQTGDVEVIAVGQRGLRQMLAHGIRPHAAEPAATSLQGLRDLVKRLAALIDHRYATGQIAALHVIYNRYQSITEQVPTEELLLPLDPSRLPRSVSRRASPPQRYLPLPELLAGLISEYAFIRLYRSAADSFASEQARRLTAMDGATRNTEHLLKSLLDLERRERQDEITRQVLELIGARFAAE
jgi:F-type H+-transporting ATPase subunit gamma